MLTGGSVDTGGSVETGGSVLTGGSVDTGGSVETGGSVLTGGSVETGGSVGVVDGGVVETGGVTVGGAMTPMPEPGAGLLTGLDDEPEPEDEPEPDDDPAELPAAVPDELLALPATAKLRVKTEAPALEALEPEAAAAAAGASVDDGDGVDVSVSGAATAVAVTSGLGVDVLMIDSGGRREGEPGVLAWPIASAQSDTVATPTTEKARTIPVECGNLRMTRQLLAEKVD